MVLVSPPKTHQGFSNEDSQRVQKVAGLGFTWPESRLRKRTCICPLTRLPQERVHPSASRRDQNELACLHPPKHPNGSPIYWDHDRPNQAPCRAQRYASWRCSKHSSGPAMDHRIHRTSRRPLRSYQTRTRHQENEPQGQTSVDWLREATTFFDQVFVHIFEMSEPPKKNGFGISTPFQKRANLVQSCEDLLASITVQDAKSFFTVEHEYRIPQTTM